MLTMLVLPPLQMDKVEGKRTSLAQIRSNRSTESSDEDLAATCHPALRGSGQGDILPLSSGSTTPPDNTIDLEAQEFDGYIRRAQPSAYWTGRFITLNDRFWMDLSEDTPKPSVRGGAQMMQEREEQRAIRVFDHLEKMCLSESARKSLWVSVQEYDLCLQRLIESSNSKF